MPNLFVSIPHSGEKIPAEAAWLKALPEEILMCDVDRYVDRLYLPSLQSLKIPYVKTDWHRYVVDLNRIPEDVDAASVQGSKNPAGMHDRGYHWCVTTHNQTLMTAPMSQALHQQLTDLIYKPFHLQIQTVARDLLKNNSQIYHLDVHSMPSVGTKMHRDPGQHRADIVVSDCGGTSCKSSFKDLVIAAYCTAGFKVAYNWPYVGGRVTEQYGRPNLGHHALQVELARDLYMDEKTKQFNADQALKVQEKITQALTYIQSQVSHGLS